MNLPHTQKFANFIWLVFSLTYIASSYAADSMSNALTLQDAERIAMDSDPLIKQVTAQQQGYQERSVAADSWPDPRFRFGVTNISTETWYFDDDPMTQAVFAYTQRFPPWGAVGAKSEQLEHMASATGEEVDNRKLQTLYSVRIAWLDVYYQYQAEQLIEESKTTFEQLKDVTRFQYRAGRGSQQDVIQAQLEMSLLEDRQSSIHTLWETAMAGLSKWIGPAYVQQDLSMEPPELKKPPSEQKLRSNLEKHPWLEAGKIRVKAAEKGVDYASAQSGPSWALDLKYGYRAAQRDDLASAVISLDMPIFTGNKQDRETKASQADLAATHRLLDERRRQLNLRMDSTMSQYRQAKTRLKLYEAQVLPEAKQNSEASLSAYQSGVTDFNILVRARLTELRSQLQYLKLQVDKAKAQVELLYLAGN